MDDIANLATALWRTRELLDEMAYRVAVQELLLADGRTEHLARAVREVEQAIQAVREQSVVLDGVAAGAAGACGLRPTATLAEIAEAAEGPFHDALLDHLEALRAAKSSIGQSAERSADLASAGARNTTVVLSRLAGESTDGYSLSGEAQTFGGEMPRFVKAV